MVLIKELSNGLKVVFEKMPHLKSVSIAFCVKVGSKNENQSNYGISHFIEHMLFKGTKKKNALKISEIIDKIGGDLNAFTTKEMTVIYTTVLNKHFDIAIELISDIFLNSVFEKEELEKEKNVIIEEIKMYEDAPEETIHEENINNFFKDTLLSNSVLGSEESVKGIDNEKINLYLSENYNLNNTFISIAGNIDVKKVMFLLEKYLSDFKNINKNQKEEISLVPMNIKNKEIKKESHQVHICVNTIGTSYISDDIFTLSVVSNLLGGGMSSRLFQEIREKKGLAYSVYTYLSSYKETGLFTTYIGTSPNNYKEVLDIVYNQYENLYKKGVSKEELYRAKNQIISSLVFDLEGSKTMMFRNMNLYFSTSEVLSINKIIKKIEKISLDDILKICNEYFKNKFYSYTYIGNV